MASRDLTAEYSALLADKIRIPMPLGELRESYRSAAPFPHIVIDDLFSPRLLDPVLAEMDAMGEERWRTVETNSVQRFRRMRSGVELGGAGAQLVGLVHSAPFLYLLSEITGVWQLLPDPYLQGAGYAAMQRGDFFNVHTDRNIAYDTGLTRRLAMIVFLNKDWDRTYHGQLELWDATGARCDVSVDPLYNRTVIFEVADPNYHGVPTPLACPEDRSRQSFIVYYHTVGTGGKTVLAPHTSKFAPGFHRQPDSPVRTLAREVTPPILRRAARKLAARLRNHRSGGIGKRRATPAIAEASRPSD